MIYIFTLYFIDMIDINNENFMHIRQELELEPTVSYLLPIYFD